MERVVSAIRMAHHLATRTALIFGIIQGVFFCQCLLYPAASDASLGPFDLAYNDLAFTKSEKKRQVEDLIHRYHRLAQSAANDDIINSFYDINYRFFSNNGDLSMAELNKLRASFDRYYLENYYSFYDILFVSLNGDVFYSLRKESDFNINIFNVDNQCRTLSTCLSKKLPHEVFIDFCMYKPSAEPASFFIEPIFKDGNHVGWIILQLQINGINLIFSKDINRNKSLESVLVNKDGCMLTDSLFLGDSTILQKYLSPKNINSKFELGDGNKEVTDYRGQRVLSSFSVIEFMDVKWLLISKVDKDDVITKEYINHRELYNRHILDFFERDQAVYIENDRMPKGILSHRVDIDEYIKATGDDVLETWGVATCVGILACSPGNVGYLAHASNKDKVLLGSTTNLLDQIDYRLSRFDVIPSRKSEIDFYLIAPHLNAIDPMLRILTAKGYLLSQINVLVNTNASSARIVYSNKDGAFFVSWKLKGSKKTLTSSMDSAQNVGAIVADALLKLYK